MSLLLLKLVKSSGNCHSSTTSFWWSISNTFFFFHNFFIKYWKQYLSSLLYTLSCIILQSIWFNKLIKFNHSTLDSKCFLKTVFFFWCPQQRDLAILEKLRIFSRKISLGKQYAISVDPVVSLYSIKRLKAKWLKECKFSYTEASC